MRNAEDDDLYYDKLCFHIKDWFNLHFHVALMREIQLRIYLGDDR